MGEQGETTEKTERWEGTLAFHLDTGQWEGDDQTHGVRVFMTNATFQRAIDSLLERRGITKPLYTQRQAAKNQCQQLSYWQGVVDPEVTIRRLGWQGRDGDASAATTDDLTS